jgi:hypothetical protein
MRTHFKLVTINERNAALGFLDLPGSQFFADIQIPADKIKKITYAIKHNWFNLFLAEVEHDGFYENGVPCKPVITGVSEYKIKR